MKDIKYVCLGLIVIFILIGMVESVNAAIPVCDAYGNSHVYAAATCTKPKTCKCGATTGSALGHNYSVFVKTNTVATCVKTGNATYKCSRCSKTVSKTIPKTSHKYTKFVSTIKAPTCQATGTAKYKCANCTATKEVTVAKVSHDYVNKSVSDTKHILKCKYCGKTSGTEVTHSFTTGKCTKCGHVCAHKEYKYTVTKAATCTTNGVKAGKCTVCGKTITASISATGHKWTAWQQGTEGKHYKVCRYCDLKDGEAEHTYGSDNKCTVCGAVKLTNEQQTCTHATFKDGKCAKCGYVCQHKSQKVATCTTAASCTMCGMKLGSAKGHNYEYTITKAATCTATGTKTGKCTRCSSTVTETISATGHKWTAWQQGTEGKHYKVCRYCDLKDGEAEHTYGSDNKCTVCGAVKLTNEQQTCTHATFKDGKCTKCGYVCQHKNQTPATCSKAAMCNICKMTLGKSKAHNYKYKVTKPATCSETGTKTGECIYCGNKIEETISIDKSAHLYQIKETKKATCKEEGATISICQFCGDEKVEEIKKTSHVYDGAAGYTGTGTYHYYHCIYCNAVEPKARKHSWGDVSSEQAGICTECGYVCQHNRYVKNKCVDCGFVNVGMCEKHNFEKVIDMYGHYSVCTECKYVDKSNSGIHTYKKENGKIVYTDLCNGKHAKVCTECGYKHEYVHVYINGKCISCGSENPTGLQNINTKTEEFDVNSKEQAKELQAHLTDLGYDTQGIDGSIGQNTIKAINSALEAIGTSRRVSSKNDITSEIYTLLMNNKETYATAQTRILYSKVKTGEASEEENIKYIQARLADLGFYAGKIDGTKGEALTFALNEFCKASGINVDDIDMKNLSRDFINKIQNSDLTYKQVREEYIKFIIANPDSFDPNDSNRIAEMQTSLKLLGYYNGAVNGKYDASTQKAIKQLLEDKGEDKIEKDGICLEAYVTVMTADGYGLEEFVRSDPNDTSFIGVVLDEKKYWAEHGFRYCLNGCDRNVIPSETKRSSCSCHGLYKEYAVDCSTAVTSYMYYYGKANGCQTMMDEFSKQKTSYDFVNIANAGGVSNGVKYFEVITDYSQLQEGDILAVRGHVEVYAGEMADDEHARVYNAGGHDSIAEEGITDSGHDIKGYKILRPIPPEEVQAIDNSN